ncbi:hypothetical protein GCM10022415_00170 [Knoellia locipacati]|uniref:Uncharacterized protein n=1 Tax=Knoellia locipacati TaxID=882824 RepID=A0A512SVI4_9MICO|nr:hypothetical protein KLO01_00170 [Knoellia locipacati]
MLGVVAVLTVVALALGAWLVLGRDGGPSSSQVAAATPEGSLTFSIPQGWRTLPCESDEGDCVRVTSPGMAAEEAATVSFLPPNPIEGTPVDLLANPDVTVPGAVRVTVDGLPAARIDPTSDGQDTTLVAGRARVEAGHLFMVVCPVGADAGRSRTVCEQVLRTLRVTR